MGNDPQKINQPPGRYITCLRYGGQVLLNEQIGTVYQHLVLEQKSVSRFTTLLEKRRKLTHPNLLTPRNSFSRAQPTSAFTCANDNKTQIFVEYSYISKTLEDVIEEYSKRHQEIPQKDICRMFVTVAEVLKYLRDHHTCHGDVKPSNILLDHIGSIKLIDSYFVSGGKTAYEIVMEHPSSMSLLSPEQLQRIRNRQFEDLSTIHSSQIFALGLSMIQAMTFQPAMECYNLTNLTIKPDYHKRKLQQLRSTEYSPKLIKLVMECISQQRQMRPSFDDFLKQLLM